MAQLKFNNTALVWPDIKFNNTHWVIYVQLYDKNKLITITESKKTAILPKSYNARYSVLSWRGDSKETQGKKETVIREGKQGRNVLQQAIAEAAAKYKKHKLKKTNDSGTKLPPMLLKIYNDYPASFYESFSEDFYIQRKYNGVRALTRLNAKSAVDIYSRNLHDYDIPNIAEAIKPYLKKNYMVDGELFINGAELQTISGIVRRSNSESSYGAQAPSPGLRPVEARNELRGSNNAKSKEEITYVIYDLYDTDKPSRVFSERSQLIKEIFKNCKTPLVIAPTYKLGKTQPFKEFDKKVREYFKDFVKEGYEGAVIRRDAPYVLKKSSNIFKLRQKYSDEFAIIGFTDGVGKNKDLLTFICETKDKREFNVSLRASSAKRRELFLKFKNDKNYFDRYYKNKKLTVEFSNLSLTGIPLEPIGLLIRDYD
jgi:ATP-dependent DNA ligase